jgi:hypothetical protein
VSIVGAVVARVRRLGIPLITLGVVAIIVTLLVLPLRTWFTQRDLLREREAQYALFEDINDALQDEVDSLQTPTGLQQAIRSQLGYLLPNERRVPLLAQPDAPIDLPARWPHTLVAGILDVRRDAFARVESGDIDEFNPMQP